jgi:hypothetical protein
LSAAKTYKGCPVFIYCSEDNYITEGIIQHHDPDWNYISILESLKEHATNHLEVVILHPGGVSEYKGTIRELNNYREIALFKHHERHGRDSGRHNIYEPARICVVDAANNPITSPMKLLVENISTSGILIKSPEDYFKLHQNLEININISGKEVVLYAEVVRIKENNNNFDVGCHFNFQKK